MNHEEFTRVYDENAPRIRRYLASRFGDAEGDDATQDVFLAVFQCIDQYRGDVEIVNWIYGIARNVMRSRFRQRGDVCFVPIDDVVLPAAGGNPEELFDTRRALERILLKVRGQTADAYEVFYLRHIHCMPVRTIAARTGRTVNAVKASLRRTRRGIARA